MRIMIIFLMLLSGMMLYSCQEDEEVAPLQYQDTKNVTQRPLARGKPDSDSDGVTNARDDCPNTSLGTEVDKRGCPIVTPGVAGS